MSEIKLPESDSIIWKNVDANLPFTFVFDTKMDFEVVIDGKTYKTDKKKIMDFIKTFITEEIK